MSVLYYNPSLVSKILNENPSLLENTPFFSGDHNLFRSYDKFGLNKHNAVYDRTGKLGHFLNITSNLHPIPNKTDCKSFYDISIDRAKELLSHNKQINVMWSGGIDSTYLLYILREAGGRDQINVLGTYNSIIESGDLFDKKIKNDFRCYIKTSSRNDLTFIEGDCIYVSGMCGNQLFGPTDDMFATGHTAMFHHTLGTPETIYEPYEKNIDPELLEFFEPMIQASPRKIETVNDLRWYCIFNLDWYTAIYEHKIMLRPDIATSLHGFFDSEDFQSWAVNTKEPFTKIKGNPNTHRWQMREVLADLGMEHYANNKSKKISTFSIHEPSWVFLLDGYQNVHM